MNGFSMSKWRVAPLVAVASVSLLAAFVFLYARSSFFAAIPPDEEQFIWYGSLIRNGDVPYRDFFEPKPPVIFFANALGLAWFGLEDLQFRLIPTAVALASLLFFYLAMIRRKVVPWLATLLTAQAALWLLGTDFHDSGLNDTETYGLAFSVLGFSIGSLSDSPKIQSAKVGLQVLSGIFFGLAILSKELFVLSVIPAWLLAARHAGHWRRQQLFVSAAGSVGVGLLFLAYLIYHSALIPYWDLITFYRLFAANYCMDMGRFPRVSGQAILLASWERLHGMLYNFQHLAFVLPLWCVLPLLIVQRGANVAARWIELVVAVMAVPLGVVSISAGYCFWPHYFLMGITGLLLLSVIGAEVLSEFLSRRGWLTSLVFLFGLSALFFWVAKDSTRQAAERQPQALHPLPRDPGLIWDSEVADVIERHSKAGDYILSTQGCLIYVELNRKAPLGTQIFLDEVFPYIGDTNPKLSIKSLRDNLEKHLPKVCYFGSWLRNRQSRYHQLLFDPLIVKYHYVKVNDRLWYLPDSKD